MPMARPGCGSVHCATAGSLSPLCGSGRPPGWGLHRQLPEDIDRRMTHGKEMWQGPTDFPFFQPREFFLTKGICSRNSKESL